MCANFDTLTVSVPDARALHKSAQGAGINLRDLGPDRVGISLDEATDFDDVVALFALFGGQRKGIEAAAEAQPDHFAAGPGKAQARTTDSRTVRQSFERPPRKPRARLKKRTFFR